MTSFNARMDLPPTPSAPAIARRVVAELLSGWERIRQLSEVRLAGMVLVVNEIVTNAVEHAGGEPSLELEISYSDQWLRISLADDSALRPMARAVDHTSDRGRGLQLVAALVDRWGAEDYQGGKRVWFEIDLPPDDRGDLGPQ